MATTLLKQPDCVSVVIDGKLGYSTWHLLRDARDTAVQEGVSLSIDVGACDQLESIGLGAILVAQGHLGKVAVKGCHSWLAEMFHTFWVCNHCANQGLPAVCPLPRP